MTLRDAEQLALIDLPVVEPNRQSQGLPILDTNKTQHERVSLEHKYRHAFEQRLDWRRLVTYVPNKQLPVYNWFKYKEGFSRELVMRLFREFGLRQGDIVFDPFVGCGTTLLAGKEFGLRGIGIDMLSTSVFVAKVKLTEWPELDLLWRAVQKLLAEPFR